MASTFSLPISLNLGLHCEHWVVQTVLFLHQMQPTCACHFSLLGSICKGVQHGCLVFIAKWSLPTYKPCCAQEKTCINTHWISKPTSPGLITVAPLILFFFKNKTKGAAVIRITSPHAFPKCPVLPLLSNPSPKIWDTSPLSHPCHSWLM